MLFVLALCLLITVILLLTAPQLILPFLLSALLWNAVSAALIHLVNRRIRTLSDQLMRVYSNSLHTDIRDNEEGALSILRNDIYKITQEDPAKVKLQRRIERVPGTGPLSVFNIIKRRSGDVKIKRAV